jgi:hypothetical protein
MMMVRLLVRPVTMFAKHVKKAILLVLIAQTPQEKIPLHVPVKMDSLMKMFQLVQNVIMCALHAKKLIKIVLHARMKIET